METTTRTIKITKKPTRTAKLNLCKICEKELEKHNPKNCICINCYYKLPK